MGGVHGGLGALEVCLLRLRCNAVCVCGVVAVNGLGAEAMAALALALGKLVSLTSLDLEGTYAAIRCAPVAHGRREWQACVVEVCNVRRVVTFLDLDVCGVVAGNKLDAEAMAAVAPALGKLVSLTSLDLRGT